MTDRKGYACGQGSRVLGQLLLERRAVSRCAADEQGWN
jgi:hypothetical protein